MVSLTPTQRLEWLLLEPSAAKAHADIRTLLSRYEDFLAITNASKTELLRRFGHQAKSDEDWESASTFGDLVFKVLEALGKSNRFYRMLVV